MQVSNSTGQSTSYRVTGSGGGNVAGGTSTSGSSGGTTTIEVPVCGKLGPLQGEEHCLGDSAGRMVEFWVGDRLVASRWFDEAPSQVSLVEQGGIFWVEGPEVTARK